VATKLFVSISLALALAASAIAQNPAAPDLSGKWVLNLAKSQMKGRNIHSEVIAIKYSGFKIKMSFTTDGKQSTEEYIADGKKRVVGTVDGRDVVQRAYWDGSALVTEISIRIDRLVGGSKTRWALSPDGRSLTCEWNDGESVLVYDKQ